MITSKSYRVRLALLLVACLPVPSAAQLYKWVDENGVVNYGDKPPARGKAVQPVAPTGGSVSVIPGIPKEELEQQRERATQQRLQRLERELDDLRARENARDSAPPEPAVTEVYVPGYGYGYGPGYGPPRRPPGAPGAKPPGSRPEQPIQKHNVFRPPDDPPAYNRR